MLMLKTVALAATTMFIGASFATEIKENQWFSDGQKTINDRMSIKPIEGKAKNIILFVADGNGIASNTAIRIYSGQKEGKNGESFELSYEKFPYTGLIKTYNTNAQTADSAGTASAMTTGVKTKQGVSGVDEFLMRGDCNTTPEHIVKTIGEVFEEEGKSTGIVTTTRITHATPAAVYAHTADRNYEANVKDGCVGQKDIATQLIKWGFGDGLDVVMGGGRRSFLPSHIEGEEGKRGKRGDGRNLIDEWINKGDNYKYIWNSEGFDTFDTESDDKLLALFNSSHMEYELDRAEDKGGEPSLVEMTEKAINRLNNNENGYFLMVEAGRVDHAHHESNAARALGDGWAFHEAIKKADEITNDEDTLIIVTADHSHTITISGYQPLNNPILGLVRKINKDGSPSDEPLLASDGKPYTTLGYMNGPGSVFGKTDADGNLLEISEREDLSEINVEDKDYLQQSLTPRSSETHGGEDVAIYAKGPWAHLFNGVSEQNIIYHVMEYASGVNKK